MTLYDFCNGCKYYIGEIDDCIYVEEDGPNTPKDRKCGSTLMYNEYMKKVCESYINEEINDET